MPPPSAHTNANSTARVLRTPRVYGLGYNSTSAPEDEPSASPSSRPRPRPRRDTSEPVAVRKPLATSTNSSNGVGPRLPVATTAVRRMSYGLPANPRPVKTQTAPASTQKQLPTKQISQQPQQQPSLSRRRSALIQEVPQINTRVAPIIAARQRGPSPSSQQKRSNHSPHHSTSSITSSGIPRATSPPNPRIYPELDRWPRHVRQPSATSLSNDGSEIPFRLTTDLPPPTPGLLSGTSSQLSASPSTRFSESPGPWPWSAGSMNNMLASPYSRDTTPTSLVSQSPCSVTVTRFATTTARKASVSPAVASTSPAPQVVNAAEPETKTTTKTKPKLSLPCPSPPPRKSSYKNLRPRDRDPVTSPTSPPVSMMTRPSRPSAEARRSISSPIRSATTATTAAAPTRTIPTATTAPRRPSRDGIPDMTGLHEPPRVIQSNLVSSHMRSGSDSNAAVAGLGMASSPERLRKLKPATSPKPAAAPRPIQREPTPAPEQPKRMRTPSPVVASSSRFAFFGKKKTVEPTASAAAAPREKLLRRKGPAAGTGHEGYGRLGAVRRRSGSLTNVFRGQSSSQESLPTDTFLLDRMSPVVISGGEVVKNHNNMNNINEGLSHSSSFNSLTVEFNVFQASASAPTLRPSAIPRTARRPSDSSDSEAMVAQSALAFRKQQRQKIYSGDAARKTAGTAKPASPLPDSVDSNIDAVFSDESSAMDAGSTATVATAVSSAPSATCAPAPAAPVTATAPSNASATALATATLAEPTHMHGLKAGPKKLIKRPRSPRRWNPFSSRSHAAKAAAPPTSPVAAAVEPVPSRKVAYYMLDSVEMESLVDDAVDAVDVHAVRDILRGADVQLPDSTDGSPAPKPAVLDPSPAVDMAAALDPPAAPYGTWSSNSSPVLPQPSKMDAPFVPPTAAQQPGSRLRQVGRIPKVVSTRPAAPEPELFLPPLGMPPSFSRPFNRVSFHAAMKTHRNSYVPTPAVATATAALLQPSSPMGTPDLATDSTVSATTLNDSPPPATYPVREQMVEVRGVQPGVEFLRFSPRKSSSDSATTSSGLYSFVSDIVAIQPSADAPLGEDEVWDEYDDLLSAPQLAYAPTTVSFPAEGLQIELFDDEEIAPLSATSSKGSPFHLEAYHTTLAPTARFTQTSSSSSTDMTERLRTIFAPKPVSPPPTAPLPTPSARCSVATTTSSCHSHLSSASSGSDSPLAQVNLRVGSMTVSKWLTFGHVMFSPVRDQLLSYPPLSSPLSAMLSPSTRSTPASLPEVPLHHEAPSVLVIDGLGNDDWSFYAAETYPAASFFNLSPRAPVPADRRASAGFPLSPPNHHQTQYTSLQHRLPFGADTFVAVVVRFPAAGPESHLRNLISEARRVLVPGGYIELSILDVDLNNMGNRGRRAVRRLKEHLREKNPATELGSTADTLLQLLNSRGFADIKSCRVGLPVGEARRSGKRDTRSLAEMMSDESPAADESITKMVSRVGRWWYARCYEGMTAGSGAETSMWRDPALLAECAEWGTSLKLMVCHARKPVDGLSRVASI